MNFLPSFSRRAFILSGTFFALLVIFSFYLFIYLPDREDNIINHRYRAIVQAGINFKEKWEASRKVATGLTSNYIRTRQTAMDLAVQEAGQHRRFTELKERFSSYKSKNPAASADSLHYYNRAIGLDSLKLDSLRQTHLLLLDAAEKIKRNDGVLKIYDKAPTDIAEIKVAADSFYYVNEQGVSDTSLIHTAIDLRVFFTSLRREDIFEEYFLFKGTNNPPLLQTKEGELFLTQKSTASSGKGDKSSTSDSLKLVHLNSGATFGDIKTVNLGNVPYKLFSTRFTLDGTDWFLYGLISEETFEAEKRSIPSIIIITYSVLLLLILFAMPLIKLSFMSPIERLHQRNVIQSAVSFILSFSLLVLCIISMDSYLVSNRNKIRNNLEIISETIKKDFDQELITLTTLADSLDKEEPKPEDLNYSVSVYEAGNSLLSDKSRKLIANYPNFDYVYWMDDKGKVVHELSALEKTTIRVSKPGDYEKRAYFREIKNNGGWFRNSEAPDPKKFYLESIFSWYFGKNSAVFSRTSNWAKARVVAISTELTSVFNVVLPPGYQFQIVDGEGRVLFHSIKNRNLQENYLKECDNNSGIFSALQSNTTAHTNITYYSQEQRAYVQPMGAVPWYIITTYNKQYSELAYSQIIIFSICSVVLLGLVVGFLTLLSTLVYYRKSKLKRDVFYLDWLRPRKDRKKEYLLILALNIASLFALLAYNSLEQTTALQALCGFGFTMIVQYAFAFALLQHREFNYFIFLGCVVIMLLLLVAGLHQLKDLVPSDKSFFVLICATAVAAYLLYDRTPMLPAPIHFRSGVRALASISFKKVYVLMLFSFLLLCGLLSPIVLFMKHYKEEMLVWEKASLYKISRDLEEKEKYIETKYAFLTGNKATSEQAGRVVDLCKGKGCLFEQLGYAIVNEQSFPDLDQYQRAEVLNKLSRPINDKLSNYEITNLLRPQISRLIIGNNGFIYPESRDHKWIAQQLDTLSTTATYYGSTGYIPASATDQKLYFAYNRTPLVNQKSILSAGVPYYISNHLKEPKLGSIIFLLLLLSVIVVVYIGLRFALKDFFTWGLVKKKAVLRIDDTCLNNQTLVQSHNLFVVSLPFSDFSSFKHINQAAFPHIVSLSQLYKEEEFNAVYKKLKSKREEKIVLDHFGYNPKDIVVSNRKLQLLERLLMNKNRVIIVSGIRPIQIIELYEDEIENLSKLSTEERAKADINQYYSNLNRWKDILSGFVKIFPSPSASRRLDPRSSVIELIRYECSASGYFDRISAFFDSLPEKVQQSNDRKVKEEVVLKIQSMAQPFYFSIWNTCSKEEKYVLYDLATDDFVNTKNINCVLMLMDKGLVYQDKNEQLHIMNESFRNFILTNIKQTEALEMEKELLQSGTYSIFKAVMVVVALSTLLFISFAERAILDSFLAVLATLTALLPLLIRLGGWFITPDASKKA